MTAIPASLFVQFIQQGLEKGLINGITKTLDGQYYCNEQYLEKSISQLVEKNGKSVYVCLPSSILTNKRYTGKIDVEKLAEHLCIEQSNVKRAIQQISADKKWTVCDDLIVTQ